MYIVAYSAFFLAVLVVLSLIGHMVRRHNGEDVGLSQYEDELLVNSFLVDKGEDSLLEDDGEECCGEHEVCEKGKIKRALRTDIEYFDDEELDRFRGVSPDEYGDDEVDEFREVLYTMRPSEIEDWLKSLELREVSLPNVLKDELFMLLRQ